MKRKIIEIDHSKCNGCGECIPACPEGALQIIEGKVRLVSDLFCDGLGECIGNCPKGAIKVVEREALPYDECRVMEKIVEQGVAVITAHLEHLSAHGEDGYLQQAIEYLQGNGFAVPKFEQGNKFSCPGTTEKKIERKNQNAEKVGKIESQLRQWPTQLALFSPDSELFENAELLLAADCAPFAYGDFHRDFLQGKVLVHFCPKLDSNLDAYVEKLAAIFAHKSLKSISIVRMEVPCCKGMEVVVQKALEKAGKSKMVQVKIITIDGKIK